MNRMFLDASLFNQSLSSWNVSKVTNMEYMFSFNDVFNSSLSNWDVSNVSNMDGMFENALYFSQNISNWNVSLISSKPTGFDTNSRFENQSELQPIWGTNGVLFNCYNSSYVGFIGTQEPCTSMLIVNRSMLDNATSINNGSDFQIEGPNGFNYTFGNSSLNIFTGQVTDLSYLFQNEVNFTGNINYWGVNNVTNFRSLFLNADSFNQPLNSWNVSSVTSMREMFRGADSFNQSINSWDVSSVKNMFHMFVRTFDFNQNISGWNTSSLNSTGRMFWGASSFNQSLNNWDVSKITDMNNMFRNAISFNQPLNGWNVSYVNNLTGIFYGATSFNQSLNNWDVSNVVDMKSMFFDAQFFNQNISSWKVPLIESKPLDFDNNSGFENQTQLQPQWNYTAINTSTSSSGSSSSRGGSSSFNREFILASDLYVDNISSSTQENEENYTLELKLGLNDTASDKIIKEEVNNISTLDLEDSSSSSGNSNLEYNIESDLEEIVNSNDLTFIERIYRELFVSKTSNNNQLNALNVNLESRNSQNVTLLNNEPLIIDNGDEISSFNLRVSLVGAIISIMFVGVAYFLLLKK